ncbi:MAG: hypothetical protein QG657_3312 [Acidobacteriota bacterium]|nr:hypothetical protein [Acidobacteriota bacterium]
MKEITVGTEFVSKSYVLLNKLAKDSDFKTKLLNEFNKDAGFIKQSLILCQNAQAAEDNYEKETKEAVQAKDDFEKKYKAAEFNFTKHTTFMKLLLKYDIKKQTALGLIAREEPKNKEDWFVYALDVYDKIIGDSSAVTLIGEYNFTLPDLQEGRQTIVLAYDANLTLTKESTEAKDAVLQKDLTFTELYDRMQFIQLCAYYIFMDIPKKFKELGLPLIDNDSGALINVKTKDMVKDASIT